jgi:hypothetical protein
VGVRFDQTTTNTKKNKKHHRLIHHTPLRVRQGSCLFVPLVVPYILKKKSLSRLSTNILIFLRLTHRGLSVALDPAACTRQEQLAADSESGCQLFDRTVFNKEQ